MAIRTISGASIIGRVNRLPPIPSTAAPPTTGRGSQYCGLALPSCRRYCLPLPPAWLPSLGPPLRAPEAPRPVTTPAARTIDGATMTMRLIVDGTRRQIAQVSPVRKRVRAYCKQVRLHKLAARPASQPGKRVPGCTHTCVYV